jgi:hypothetical protein
MTPKTKAYALVIKHLKNGNTKIEKVEMEVDRTRRPMRPELRKQIEARYGKRLLTKRTRKK